MSLIEYLRHKKAWFDGKWSLDDKKRSDYVPTAELLGAAAKRIEDLEKSINSVIDYCYEFERKGELNNPRFLDAFAVLIPIQQDLQAAVGR
jgi:hypothetical protein